MAATKVKMMRRAVTLPNKTRSSMETFEKITYTAGQTFKEKSFSRKQEWLLDRDEFSVEDEDIASGQCGAISFATYKGLKCVVKKCTAVHSKQNIEDIKHEIDVLGSLRHPNLVLFLGAYLPGRIATESDCESPLLFMEYISGGNLEQRLRRGWLSSSEKIKFTYEIALAVYYLHTNYIIHRDLKPANILLAKGSKDVKITDFGLCKLLDISLSNKRKSCEHEENQTYEMTGGTGSLRFMAPEVMRNDKYNFKVDVYSFAMITYWIYTGVEPFAEYYITREDFIKDVSTKGLRPKRRINNYKIDELVRECWSQDAAKRPNFEVILGILEGKRNGAFRQFRSGSLRNGLKGIMLTRSKSVT